MYSKWNRIIKSMIYFSFVVLFSSKNRFKFILNVRYNDRLELVFIPAPGIPRHLFTKRPL